jgi:hypothetical protein
VIETHKHPASSKSGEAGQNKKPPRGEARRLIVKLLLYPSPINTVVAPVSLLNTSRTSTKVFVRHASVDDRDFGSEIIRNGAVLLSNRYRPF